LDLIELSTTTFSSQPDPEVFASTREWSAVAAVSVMT
jgi:hypothetical protein